MWISNIYSGRIAILLLLLVSFLKLNSQTVDHWETVIMAGDTWSFFPGNSEPPSDWAEIDFNDSSWQRGKGGIGYGDGDDGTLIGQIISVYLRMKFDLVDTSVITMVLLHIDFDDGFVAYLNGHEIARANLGTSGIKPPFNEFAILSSYEARLPNGAIPARYLIDKNILAEYLNKGENVFAIQVHNCDATSSDLSSTSYFSVGISDTGHYYRETPDWFNDPFNELSNLPLIVIDTRGGTITDEPKINSHLKVIDNGQGFLNNLFQEGTDYDGNIGIEVRGQSSQMFPKKSYSIELRGKTWADTSVSLLGMPAGEDWVLYAPYSDKTLLRNALTFQLGSMMGEWQPRNRFCEVYLNGDYNGIYVLTESIKRDSNRVDISKLKTNEITGDDLTGGYIIKADKVNGYGTDEYFTIFPLVRYNNSDNYKFTYVYPDFDEIAQEQKNYLKKYLTDAENALNGETFSDPVNGFRRYLDVKSFVDFQIIQELTNNVDGYRFSTYFYKDKDSRGGKLHAGPLWDFDLCYGNEDYTDFNLQTDIWLYSKYADEYGGRMHWWARLMEDISYRSVFISRWKELRKGAFKTDSIMIFLDKTIESLGDAINRNFSRWPILGTYVWPNYFVGQTYEDEVDYLKGWITERVNWIDANIMGAEGVTQDHSETDVLVFPNPVRDKMNLYFYLTFYNDVIIEIFDLMGRKVFHDVFEPEREGFQYLILDVNHLASGYYIVQLKQGDRLIGRGKILLSRK